MSIFDPPKEEKLSDVFPMGEKFWLLYAEFEGVQPTTYGASPQASISVCEPDHPEDAKQFRVWGVLASQIQEMEDGEIPAEVYIGQQGRKHVWVPVRKIDLAAPTATTTEQEEPPY